MTPRTLAELHTAATPGPWVIRHHQDGYVSATKDTTIENAELAARLRNAVPEILALLEKGRWLPADSSIGQAVSEARRALDGVK